MRYGRWDQTLICSSVSNMVFNCKSKLFPWIDYSRAEDFVCLNHHEFGILLDDANSLVLMWEEIVADGAEMELMFHGLAECLKASFECKGDVPSTRFIF